jgi:MacB-like periplasmic core domain
VGRRITGRELLIAVQIAICAVLVTSSMVAVRELARSLRNNFGFEPRNAILAETDLHMAGYRGDAVPTMQKRMINATETIPDVTSVGSVDSPPLHMGPNISIVFTDKATDLRPSNAAADAIMYSVSPEYFHAAGTALLAGRDFTWHDDKDAPRVALVNREFARRIFGSATDATGRYFKRRDGTRIQVVGIVEDGKYTANLAEDRQPAMINASRPGGFFSLTAEQMRERIIGSGESGSRSIALAFGRFDTFRFAILAASRAAGSMVVQLDVDGLEPRSWTTRS